VSIGIIYKTVPTVLLFFFICLTAAGQVDPQDNDNDPMKGRDSMLLENERIEELPVAEKPGIPIPAPDLKLPEKKLEYKPIDVGLEFKVPPPPLIVQSLPLPTPPETFANALKLGYGRYNTLWAEAILGNGRNTAFDWGINLNHRSSAKGHITDAGFNDTKLSFAGNYALGLSNAVRFAGLLHHYRYNCFGDTTLTNTNADRANDSLSYVRNFTRIDFEVGLTTKPTTELANITYDLPLRVQAYADRQNKLEVHFSSKPTIALTKENGLTLKAQAQLYYSTLRAADTEARQWNATLSPTIGYKNKQLAAEAGVRIGSTGIKDSSWTLIAPVFKLTYRLSPEFAVVLDADGNIEYLSRFTLVPINPYIAAEIPYLQPFTEKWKLSGGSVGSIEKLDYDLRVAYRSVAGYPIFKTAVFNTDTTTTLKAGYFNLAYEAAFTELSFNSQINYQLNDQFTAGLKLRHSSFNLPTNTYNFAMPNTELQMDAAFKPIEKIKLASNLHLIGSRPMVIDNNNAIIKADPFIGFNFNADYDINSQLSVWLKIMNLFNSKYYRWYGYQERRLDWVIGAALKF
jgi:hypothetical protein